MKPLLVGLLIGLVVGSGLTYGILKLLNPPVPPTLANDWGVFPVAPQAEWLPDGRKMRLLSDFYYIDSRQVAWVAPAGTEVDGASIPQVLWSILGGPFEGQHRDASIVHDIECVRKKRPWHEVHYMFYEACRCGGVSESKAKLLYAGVYHGGPRWAIESRVRTTIVTNADGTTSEKNTVDSVVTPMSPGSALDEAALQKLAEYIEQNNPSVESLQAIDVNTL
jgi:hypothetical protein